MCIRDRLFALVATACLFAFAGDDNTARIDRTRMDVRQLCKAMDNYRKDFGEFPPGTSAQIMDALMNGDGRKRPIFFAAPANRIKGGELIDPWGHPYRLGHFSATEAWAYSFGPDGIDEG